MRIPFLPWRKRRNSPSEENDEKSGGGLIIGGAIGLDYRQKLLEDRHARHVEKEDTKD